MNDRPDYITGLQQCAQCEGWKLVLEDGVCYACLFPPPKAQPVPEYGVTLYHQDGTHDQTFRFRLRARAEQTYAWFHAVDPRRVKFETFPPAGLLPAEFPRAVRPEGAAPTVAAPALLSAEAK